MSDKQGRRIFEDLRDDVDEELAFHFEERVRDYMASGMDESSARAAARARLGDLGAVRVECDALVVEEMREGRWRRWRADLLQDVSFGLRSARKSPLFTLLAIVTLALGIGANAAVFGVVKSVLLDALPYAGADEIVRVYGRRLDDLDGRLPLSRGAAVDYMQRNGSLQQTSVFFATTYEAIFRPSDGPRMVPATLVDASFVDVLGTKPVIGRSFTQAEIDANAYVIMLSYDAWQREFQGDPSILGRTIHVAADAWQVVGVLPEGFTGPMGEPDLWLPLRIRAGLEDPASSRTSRILGMIGRLRPGVTLAAARRDLSNVAADLAREHPATDGGQSVSVLSMRESMAGEARTPLLALLASAGLVLLVACANLASALLSRSISRREEFAVRAALGAGRGRLIRQLLTESVMLTLTGATAGLLLAHSGLAVLRRLRVAALPAYADLSLDTGAVAVTALVAMIAGVAIGIVPARSLRRMGQSFRYAGRSGTETSRSSRLRGFLVSTQLALCLTLLMGAGLLARSLIAMTSMPLGFDPAGVLTVSVPGPIPARPEVRRQFFDELSGRVRTLPGVTGVALTNELPAPEGNRTSFSLETMPGGGLEAGLLTPYATVSDDYFDVMRIPLVSGRAFGPADATGEPVVVISQEMARRYWPGGEAIGSHIRASFLDTDERATIIGIAGDIRRDPVRATAETMIYASMRQANLFSNQVYVVRADGSPLALVNSFRRELIALDPTVPMDDVMTLASHIGDRLNLQRLPALLLSAFAMLALVLAAVGVYALFSNLAGARERELGVRIALGSSPQAIALLVLRQGSVWALAGLALGVAGALLVGNLLRDLLFTVSPLDPLTISCALSILLVVGAIALLVPVRRATRADAVSLLR